MTRWLSTALRFVLLFTVVGSNAEYARALPKEVPTELKSIVSRVDSLKRSGTRIEASTLLDSAMLMARSKKDTALLGRLMLDKAAMLESMGESGRALSLLYEAMRTVRSSGDSLGLAEVLNSIGTIQHNQKNFEKAEEYYRSSGAIYQELGLQRETGKYWNNLGSLYEDRGDPAEAIKYHRLSLAVWHALGASGWAAVSYMQLGACYSKLGETDSARYFLRLSLNEQEEGGGQDLRAATKLIYGTNENRAGRHREALQFCKESLALAEQMQARMLEQEACDCISKAYDALGDKGLALDYYRRSIILRDTLYGEAKVKNLTRIEMDHEFTQKELADSLTRAKRQVEEQLVHQQEVAKEREARNLALYGAIGVLLLAIGLWSRLRFMRISRAKVQRERARTERLLLNILPASVAQELKDNGKVMARDYPRATILFSDFKDFTRISQTMSPQVLVEELDHCFKAFDRIMATHQIEKIKTIGDAYMCVGGLPDLSPAMPSDVVQAALELQEFVARRKTEREAKGLVAFTMRVGIHTGPVVAGVVGLRKFAFDIWGDAVNTACAMEHSGEEGKVNISDATYQLVKDDPALICTRRGMVEAKGKGEMEMYFVERKAA